jgi:hypothetical protein
MRRSFRRVSQKALGILLIGMVVASVAVAPIVEAQTRPPGPLTGRGGMYVPPPPRTLPAPRTPSVPYRAPGPIYGSQWRLPPAPGPRLSPYFNSRVGQTWLTSRFNSVAGRTASPPTSSTPPATGAPPTAPFGSGGPRPPGLGW